MCLVRLGVPVVYLVVASCLALDAWEQRTRLIVADEVAAKLREAPPTTLPALTALLGRRAGEVRIREVGQGEDAERGASVELLPRVWLHLWVDLGPEPDAVQSVHLIYANSDEVPLERPRDGIPDVAANYGALIALAAVLACVWFLSATTMQVRGWKRWAGAATAGLGLLLYVPLALIALMRISM